MISIFSQIDKELRSWIAVWRSLRGLDHYGLNFDLTDREANAGHESPASQSGGFEPKDDQQTLALHAKWRSSSPKAYALKHLVKFE